MPSDAKKKREQKKKEAAKRGKKPAQNPEEATNGVNGEDSEVKNGKATNGSKWSLTFFCFNRFIWIFVIFIIFYLT